MWFGVCVCFIVLFYVSLVVEFVYFVLVQLVFYIL
jgi:hypothetical protein